ncbi:unnamed protein product [Nesidiocoris tenuis]|uniref:Uncharacterized protein n=1 Tax=Nesidiocoris tenuis TaxID=355587 RepID=A0A6H5HFS3_9HEMI|nr:unnamed protein product [Nesidiocoris tenuis]
MVLEDLVLEDLLHEDMVLVDVLLEDLVMVDMVLDGMMQDDMVLDEVTQEIWIKPRKLEKRKCLLRYNSPKTKRLSPKTTSASSSPATSASATATCGSFPTECRTISSISWISSMTSTSAYFSHPSKNLYEVPYAMLDRPTTTTATDILSDPTASAICRQQQLIRSNRPAGNPFIAIRFPTAPTTAVELNHDRRGGTCELSIVHEMYALLGKLRFYVGSPAYLSKINSLKLDENSEQQCV